MKERRISLRTKNPQEARFKASCLSGIMVSQYHGKPREMTKDYFDAAEQTALLKSGATLSEASLQLRVVHVPPG